MDGLDRVNMTVCFPAALCCGTDAPRQRELYFKSILPIGVLFSGSLILGNTAYLTCVYWPQMHLRMLIARRLSVSFIQMLKVRWVFV